MCVAGGETGWPEWRREERIVPQVREPSEPKPLLVRQGTASGREVQKANKTEIHSQFCPFLLCALGPVSRLHRVVMRECM